MAKVYLQVLPLLPHRPELTYPYCPYARPGTAPESYPLDRKCGHPERTGIYCGSMNVIYDNRCPFDIHEELRTP